MDQFLADFFVRRAAYPVFTQEMIIADRTAVYPLLNLYDDEQIMGFIYGPHNPRTASEEERRALAIMIQDFRIACYYLSALPDSTRELFTDPAEFEDFKRGVR